MTHKALERRQEGVVDHRLSAHVLLRHNARERVPQHVVLQRVAQGRILGPAVDVTDDLGVALGLVREGCKVALGPNGHKGAVGLDGAPDPNANPSADPQP